MSEMNPTLTLLKEYGGAVLLALAVALITRALFVEVYRVPSSGMRPTLEAGDTIFVSKSSYGFRFPGAERPLFGAREPRRGDVVVVAFPTDPAREFVKRVVGIPGDLVEIRGGRILLNAKPLEWRPEKEGACALETLPDGPTSRICTELPPIADFGPQSVPPGHVFVAGDLRTAVDLGGRGFVSYGMTPNPLIKGKVLRIWISVDPQKAESGFLPKFRSERFLKPVL